MAENITTDWVKKPSELEIVDEVSGSDSLYVESDSKLKGTLISSLDKRFVPYSGAVTDVNLGSRSLYAHNLTMLKNLADSILVSQALDPNKDLEIVDARYSTLEDIWYDTLALHLADIETKVSKAVDVPAILGFSPRNLAEVYGTSTVPDTFFALRAQVSTGDFSGLLLGDYIDLDSFSIEAGSNATVVPAQNVIKNDTYQNTRVEIVSFDHYFGIGTTPQDNHHVVMQFKNCPFVCGVNSSSSAYTGSALYAWLQNQVLPSLVAAIGLTPYTQMRAFVDDVNVAASAWVTDVFFPPASTEVFGIFPDMKTAYFTTVRQFPIYSLNPSKIVKRYNGERAAWWCAEPFSDSGFTFFSSNFGMLASNIVDDNSVGLSLAFLI